MAILHSYDLQGSKDSFADWISNISPEDTFIVTGSKKESTPQVRFKWQTDHLDPSVYDLASVHEVIEGAEAGTPDIQTLIATRELNGFTQIFRKVFAISDSALATSVHGRQGELKLQLEKAGKELKNIMEVVFSSKQEKRYDGVNPTRTDGLFKQIAAKDAQNPDLPASAGESAVHIETAGSKVITVDEFDKVTFSLFKAGSKACVILANPINAPVLNTLAIAQGAKIRQLQTFIKTEADPAYAPLGGLDEQVSITDNRGKGWCICYSRFCPVDLVYFVHPDDLTQRVLREPKATQMGKQGAFEVWQLVIEAGLCLANPFAAGVIEVKQ